MIRVGPATAPEWNTIPRTRGVKVISAGSIRKGDIDAWVGVEPPVGPDDLWVNLRAPHVDEPDLTWGYCHPSMWWDYNPLDADACFNHTTLFALLSA